MERESKLAAGVRSCRCGAPDWTVSNFREYLLTGIANAVPKTTRQRAGRQAETVVGVGPTGPANTTIHLPAGPAAHHAVPGLPPREDAWRSQPVAAGGARQSPAGSRAIQSDSDHYTHSGNPPGGRPEGELHFCAGRPSAAHLRRQGCWAAPVVRHR